jgi:dihydrofolate reductase
LDGFYAGDDGSIDWFIHDFEVDKAAHQLMSPDTLLFGRETYQQFESFWPAQADNPDAPPPAKKMSHELNNMTKIVFSKSLKEVTWENSTLVSDDIAAAAQKVKEGEGADIAIFGSGTIVQQLADAGLIDEYLIVVTPVILGSGQALFEGYKPLDLELSESRSFSSGNVLLHYKVNN